MATTTSILWTALPNGGERGAFKLSIYASPRLEGTGATGRLSDYDLGNWPEYVLKLAHANVPLQVELGGAGGPRFPALIDPTYLKGLDPDLWNQVFPKDETEVAPRHFQDHSKRWIRSYSVRPLEAYIQNLYNTIASASPNSFPDIKANTPVTKLTDALARAMPVIDKGLPGVREPKQPKRYLPVPPRGAATHPDRAVEAELDQVQADIAPEIPLKELFRAYRFFRRGNHLPYRSKDEPRDENLISDRPEEPKFDFHQAMAALGDHPFLLRKLGLIIDCTLPIDPQVLAQYPQLQLVVPPHLPVQDLTPWTRYMLSQLVGFRPRPRDGSDLHEGMLRLDNKEWFDVIQSDPDGNVIKVFDYAVNMHKVRTDLLIAKNKNPGLKSSQKKEETSLPALRSGGLMVTRLARDNKLWGHLAAQRQHEAAPEDAILFADDVLRGYRVDVQYQGKWHSLCRWYGQYEVAGKKFDHVGPDEGYLKADSASSDDGPTVGPQKPDLYVHEALVAWRNWSLVARQPGKTIVPEERPGKRQEEVVRHSQNQPAAGFAVSSNFRAEKRSLPPLRYGETYRMRARAVDLAGNSLAPPPSDLDRTPTGQQPPAGIGESEAVRYLRFDPVPAPAFVLTTPVTAGESEQVMVVRHRGGLASETPAPLPPSLGLDESKLFNPTNDRWLAAPKTTVGEAETHKKFDELWKTPDVAFALLQKESGSFDDNTLGAKIIDIDGNTVAYPPTPMFKKGDPLPDGMYFVHTEDPVQLPYLPDPLAHGVAFMPLDDHGEPTGEVLHKAFEGSKWPDAAPFRLTLQEGTGTPSFDLPATGPARVKVPRGRMLRVRYASAVVPPGSPTEGELDLMGRWHGMTAAGRGSTKGHHYQHWMLTPWRTVTLVNAVEKPLESAVVQQLGLQRLPGETFVRLLRGEVKTDAPSTGEIELRGRWDDYIDDPLDETGWHVVPKEGHVLDRKVEYTENQVDIPAKDATGKPTEEPKHEFGDTKHRIVRYRAVGTTRYREYFPHKLTGYEDPATKQKFITLDGPELVKSIPSSARPLPPEVLYIVPTFKWVETPSGRQRKGRGLRIYLQRGWFSSGQGELLGVVLMPNGLFTIEMADQLREFASLWGADPIFDREGPTTTLTTSHFTHDPVYPETAPVLPAGENILLAEKNLRMRVLGFKPQFDAERKLWYVDVELSPANLYYTFVRFGLCRYQPESLADLQISRVVRAEFAQLLADRNATLSYGDKSINITVSGPSALSKLGHRINGDDQPIVIKKVDAEIKNDKADPKGSAKKDDKVTGPIGNIPPVDLPGPPGQPPIVVPPPLFPNQEAGAAHLVTAHIEARPAGSAGDLGWEPLDGGVRLTPHTTLLSTDTVYWKGVVRWPRPGAPKNREFRLVLRELELYQTDSDMGENIPGVTGTPVRSRLVYVDTFPLRDE